MKERIGLQRKQVATPVIANPSLVASETQTKVGMSSGSAFSGHDLSRIATFYQAKLTIGQPGDKYEQEADRVADLVMAISEPAQVQREELPEEEELQMKPLAETISLLVQREELPEEEEELPMKSLDNSIQREELSEEEEELQMKQSSPSTQTATPDLESQLSSSKGRGNPLSDDVRSFMEPRFGADFSGVRVHTGSDAIQMNQGVNAQAFAHGSDIYFGAGKAPEKDALTAHELTHVVQQKGSAVQRELIQRDEDDKNQVVNFDNELELPIELKDKKGQTVFTQAAELTLSLNTQALYTAKSRKFKFSFGKLKLAGVVSAVSEMDGGGLRAPPRRRW